MCVFEYFFSAQIKHLVKCVIELGYGIILSLSTRVDLEVHLLKRVNRKHVALLLFRVWPSDFLHIGSGRQASSLPISAANVFHPSYDKFRSAGTTSVSVAAVSPTDIGATS